MKVLHMDGEDCERDIHCNCTDKTTMQKAHYVLLLSIVSIVVGSCQKESFDGYTEIAVGEWHCIDAFEIISGFPNNPSDTVYLNLETELEVVILDKGRVCIYEDGKKLKSSRVERITVSACCEPYRNVLLRCPNLTNIILEGIFTMGFDDNPDRFKTATFIVPQEELLPNSFGRFYVFERVD